jgi:flagellar biosynthesis protein FlhF
LLGLEEKLLSDLAKTLNDEITSGYSSDQLKNHAMRWMLKKLRIAPEIKKLDSPVIHLFCGTPGSGKTTSLAKIAATLKKKTSLSLALGHLEGSQLVSLETLKMYAKLLDIPVVSFKNSSDYKEKTLSNLDVILIDTTSIGVRNVHELENIAEFTAKAKISIISHLVLSLTEKQTHLDQSIRQFSSLGISTLLFTRLDETWSHGEIVNLTNRWSIPLSYFGTGPNIPADIENATRERVIERLFRL